MITDIHRHFVPQYFFATCATMTRSPSSETNRRELHPLHIRGMHFGLNKTFFELPRQLQTNETAGRRTGLFYTRYAVY